MTSEQNPNYRKGYGGLNRRGFFGATASGAATLPDDQVNPAGVKRLGELGNVGTAAAIAAAVHHATGQRIRDLPIRLDDLLSV